MLWPGLNWAGFMSSTSPWFFSPMNDPLPLGKTIFLGPHFCPGWLLGTVRVPREAWGYGELREGGVHHSKAVLLKLCRVKEKFFFFLICNLSQPDILEGAIKVTKNGIKKPIHTTPKCHFFIRFNRHKLILPNGYQHFKCFLSILSWSPLWMVTKMTTAGLILNSNILKDTEEPPKACHFLAVLLLWSSEGSHCSRWHYRSAGLWPQLHWNEAGAYKVTERGHRGKLGSAGCWPLSQQGIYAQLSSGLFNADAQVWEQFVIGRFMAYKHIVWYTVINSINNFKIVYTSYFQHLVLLIICLPDSN